ncbi:dTDP-4-dehydrorhamnose 3,5-epimerase [Methylophilaceae bacterium]|jgi:dTDP-4-dehydrorhamnose 3,5-epimerase|nr:dTDP-4-dehydrorhamnose 3,5-epimerase [Methylophilaceae bacterium]
MKVTSLKIPDVKLIESDVFEDECGFFYESFNQQKFNEGIGQKITFVQDNQSQSSKGTIRGLHYQTAPCAQDKLISCLQGKVYAVVLDIRLDSKTYGQWVALTQSEQNKRQLWIPCGFAYGFQAITNANVFYKTDAYYSKDHERSISSLSTSLAIDWPINSMLLSDKDRQAEPVSFQ